MRTNIVDSWIHTYGQDVRELYINGDNEFGSGVSKYIKQTSMDPRYYVCKKVGPAGTELINYDLYQMIFESGWLQTLWLPGDEQTIASWVGDVEITMNTADVYKFEVLLWFSEDMRFHGYSINYSKNSGDTQTLDFKGSQSGFCEKVQFTIDEGVYEAYGKPFIGINFQTLIPAQLRIDGNELKPCSIEMMLYIERTNNRNTLHYVKDVLGMAPASSLTEHVFPNDHVQVAPGSTFDFTTNLPLLTALTAWRNDLSSAKTAEIGQNIANSVSKNFPKR